MNIIVDVDCTVADLVGAICTLAHDQDRSKADKWDWFTTAYSPESVDKIKSAMIRSSWWNKLPLIKDAPQGIAWLRGQGHNIIWVTAPFKPCFGWCDVRRAWLISNFRIDQHNEPLIFTKRKYLIHADLIIDDMETMVDEHGAFNPDSKGLVFGSELNCQLDRQLVSWEDIMQMTSLRYENRRVQDV